MTEIYITLIVTQRTVHIQNAKWETYVYKCTNNEINI
jgi:hypothetical protein